MVKESALSSTVSRPNSRNNDRGAENTRDSPGWARVGRRPRGSPARPTLLPQLLDRTPASAPRQSFVTLQAGLQRRSQFGVPLLAGQAEGLSRRGDRL